MNELVLLLAGGVCGLAGYAAGWILASNRHHREWLAQEREHVAEMMELSARHSEQLTNIIEYGRPSGKKPAEVTNTTPPEDEVVIRQLELDALTNHLMEQGNVSKERAREEAERMLARVSGNL